jgi:hypothetical protein
MTFDQTWAEDIFGPRSGSIEIRNLRGIVTGRLGAPVVEAETLRAEAGVITAIGAASPGTAPSRSPGCAITTRTSCSPTSRRARTCSAGWRATCTAASRS